MDMMRIVIGIPTFRRPRELATLLTSLAPERAALPLIILVADNGCDAEIQAITAAHGVHYVPVPERGLASVRNALVAEATRIMPDWRWLAMLDDDGRVNPPWITPFLTCAEALDADLIGGPVEGDLPADAGRLARNSLFAGRRQAATGIVATLGGTQNLLVARRLVDRLGPPLFRPAFNQSGGEDYDLFRRAGAAGARLAWCAEAVVQEPVPAAALRPRRLLGRYYSTGLYAARIDRTFDGPTRTWALAARGLAGAVGRGALATACGDWDGVARSVLMLGHHAGRVAGLLGVQSRRYATS